MPNLARPNPQRSRPRKLQRFVRWRDLPAYTGLKRTQLRELIKKRQFPEGFPISDDGRAKAWAEDWLIDWQRERMSKRRGTRARP